MLADLRVLSLTDERGLLCGRLLADLGADVVQLEPTEGSPARSAPPVSAADGCSFLWEAYAAGTRSIACLPAERTDGELLRGLLDRADAVIFSGDTEELAAWGLTLADFLDRPRLIVTTITAFGWDGPKATLPASDLTVWAAAGPLAPHRDGDRPPVAPSMPQAYLHAAADAAVGTLLALAERDRSGLGQHVDVSAQISASQATLSRVLAAGVGDDNPEFQQSPVARSDHSGSGAATPNRYKKWAVRDGLVELHLSMGAAAGAFTNRLFGWIAEAGRLDPDLAEWDWRTVPECMQSGELELADLERARAAVREFLAERTQAEVLAAAMARRLLCIPILDMADVAASEHLAAREFFARVDMRGHSGLIPAFPGLTTSVPSPRLRHPAPGIDDHRDAILADWLPIPRTASPTQESAAPEPRQLPLAGLRVLDLSWVVAGPLIGRTLADFGADVIRVESSTRIDTARMMQPFHGGHPDREGSALYGNCNAGKRGITVDLTSPDGQQIVRDLVARADVVLESFAPGQLAKWGLAPEELRQIRPDLVVLSTSIAGQHGPWSTLAGFGNVGSSLSGFQLLVGWPDRLPLGPFGPYTDYVGPRLSLVTLLATLRHRARTGAGCHIDVSQLESGVYFLAPQIAQATRDGVIAHRTGNTSEAHAPQGVYATADPRFLALTIAGEREWHALTQILGRPDLHARAALGHADGRRAEGAEIDAAIQAWAAAHDADEAERLLQEAGIPAHLAQRPEDYLQDRQLAHRDHLVHLPHPLHGTTCVEGARVRLSNTPGGPTAPAPMLGEHTAAILHDDLGYSHPRIDDLRTRGVLR